MWRFDDRGGRVRLHGDDGASLVITVLMIVILLAFCAFAVDLGMAYSTRRQDQTAVDVSAIAGGQRGLSGGSIGDMANEVITRSFNNVAYEGRTLTEWRAAWLTCSDPDAVGRGYTVAAGASPCIRFTNNRQRMRVKLPENPLGTSFASLLGVDTIDVTAKAEVNLFVRPPGGVLPFGIPNNDAGVNFGCLKSGSNPNSSVYPYGVCEGNTTGNFGRLDFRLFGNLDDSMPTVCTNASADARTAINISMGVDHPLQVAPGLTGSYLDGSRCPTMIPPIDSVDTQTGGTNNGIYNGFIAGASGWGFSSAGRLAKLSSLALAETSSYGWSGMTLDSTPLWKFIPTGLVAGTGPGKVPEVCRRETFSSSYVWPVPTINGVVYPVPPWRSSNWVDGNGKTWNFNSATNHASLAHMIVCLDAWRTGRVYGYGPIGAAYTTPLFTMDSDGDPGNGEYDIQKVPRFAWVPQLWQATFPNGSSQPVSFERFRPVYVNTLYYMCNASSCTWTWSAGEARTTTCPTTTPSVSATCGNVSPPSNNGHKPDSVAALVLQDGMLPPEVIEHGPGGTASQQIQLIW